MKPTAFPRRRIVALIALASAFLFAAAAHAHHGWRWTKDGNFEITGAIKSAKLGYPHGVVRLDVNGTEWTVEVGQPWRNQRAGLKDSMFVKGTTMTFIGHRSAKESERVVKAERVRLNGKLYVLYPDRD